LRCHKPPGYRRLPEFPWRTLPPPGPVGRRSP